MAITKKSGRQDVIVATADMAYGDFEGDNVYSAAVDLPVGAIVLGGGLYVTTLFNSGTDDKFSIGHKVGAAASVDAYYAALSADITATGLAAAIVTTGAKYAEPSTVGVVWNPSGTAASAGVARLVVEYIVDGRAAFSQG